MFLGIHRGIVFCLVVATASRIHGDLLAINLSADLIRNAIVVTINETDDCFSVADLFPGGLVVLQRGQYHAEEVTSPSSTDSGLPHSPPNSIIVTYNLQQDRVCDRGRGHLVLAMSANKEGGVRARWTTSDTGIQLVTVKASSQTGGYDNKRSRLREASSTYRDILPITGAEGIIPSVRSVQAFVRGMHTGKRQNRDDTTMPEELHLADCFLYHFKTNTTNLTSENLQVVIQRGGILVSADRRDSAASTQKRKRQLLEKTYGIGESKNSLTARHQTTPSEIVDLFAGPEEPDDLYTIGHGGLDTRQSTQKKLADDAVFGDENNSPGSEVVVDTDSNPCKTPIEECCEDRDCSGDDICVARQCHAACDVQFDECCDDDDCAVNSNEICFVRKCIEDGFPRFTLSWYGDDDLDLLVITPDGTPLSHEHKFDEASGGRLGEPVDQVLLPPGFRVENVYFPMAGTMAGTAPEGAYSYYVEPLVTVGDPDSWTLTISDENGVVQTKSGTLSSSVLTYIRGSSPTTIEPKLPPEGSINSQEAIARIPSPSPPKSPEDFVSPSPTPVSIPTIPGVSSIHPTNSFQPSRICLVPYDECCETKDCLFDEDICVHRNCIDDGFLRITLQWVGDDDLDLFVVTPEGIEISFNNFFDPVSLGRFGEDADQFGSGYHVENVYFPMDGAPHGYYRFFVRPLVTVGDFDKWTVSVVEDGDTVTTELGYGFSDNFAYVRQPAPPAISPPTLGPPTQENPSTPNRPPLGGVTSPSVSSPTSTQPPSNAPFPSLTPSLRLVDLPLGPPTRTPENVNDCSVFSDECCVHTDCPTAQDVCEQRTCLKDGNPRITLLWTGDDDLDLFVRTPDGIEISSDKTFDSFSGGRYSRDVDQSNLGFHVESVSFPILGSPSGTYEYGVRSVVPRSGADVWFIEIREDADLVETQGGSGNSISFAYTRRGGADGPQRPRPLPPRCSPVENECCIDSDCSVTGEICVQRSCIDDGSLRLSLKWIGDDDLDLFVETPENAVISRNDKLDPLSGGRYGENPQQSNFGFHVESVYFPVSGAPIGTYRFSVKSSATRGVGADVWTVGVYESGQEVQEETGIGDSRVFLFERVFVPSPTMLPAPPTPPGPIPATPINLPISTVPAMQIPSSSTNRSCPDRFECCSDSDCKDANQTCVQRTCVADGSLRFDLTWIGNEGLNLAVLTPMQATISFQTPVDQESGGMFQQDPYRPGFDFHLESIIFPSSGGPEGVYSFLVRAASPGKQEDMWTLRIYEFGGLVGLKSGSGDSRTFTYEYGKGDLLTPTDPPVRPPSSLPPYESPRNDTSPPSPPSVACQADLDCKSGIEVCLMELCIDEGNPRFSLQWIGNDDIDLFVATPAGVVLSSSSTSDPVSGGRFGEPGAQLGFGMHVENVHFPFEGGPAGVYEYYVLSSRIEGSDDSWVVSVSINGEDIVLHRGSGSSDVYVFEFGGDIPDGRPDSCGAISACETNELCVQETCIDEGTPQFVLTWEGDDDLGLFVVTPLETTITPYSTFDSITGGTFGESGIQNTPGRHIENIFFAPNQGPLGFYGFSVQTFRLANNDDPWTVSIYVEGRLMAVESGQGSSEVIFFEFTEGSEPSLAPSLDFESCNSSPNGCCSDDGCLSNEACAFGTCVDEGSPRFTLSWQGKDDLDLLVLTPLGTVISFANVEEPVSGGKFGEEFDQFDFGQHVENIYFPAEGGPSGEYSYYVRSFIADGTDDTWTVNIYVDGQQESSITGNGDSTKLSYSFLGLPTSPTPIPQQLPSASPQNQTCDILDEECCADSDCIGGVESCTQKTCIDVGIFRFTLTWTGDDDLDLVVVTPLNTTISFVNPLDRATGGVFGEEGTQYVFDDYAENIFFSTSSIPLGTYTFSVASFEARGNGDDEWAVSVFIKNVLVAVQSGRGDSEVFSFVLKDGDFAAPTTPPVCSPSIEGCCVDSECTAGLEICVQGTCISKGLPRFTLEYSGDDKIDLTIVTPMGTTLSGSSPVDKSSGGRFESNGELDFFGRYVESVYFSLEGGPVGTYTYLVSTFDQTGLPDSWTIRVFEGDVEVTSATGSGNANFLYEFLPEVQEGSSMSTGSPITAVPSMRAVPTPIGPNTTEAPGPGDSTSPPPVIRCQTSEEECCHDADCPSGRLCVQRNCIEEGNPRFTLTWTGGEDYDLTVTPPVGGTISFLGQSDMESGGRFGENGVRAFSGLHVENVFFPVDGGPIGSYEANVQLIDAVSELPVATWTLQVYVNGQVVLSQGGAGDGGGPIPYTYEAGSNFRAVRSGASAYGSDGWDGADDPAFCSVELGDMCCRTSDCYDTTATGDGAGRSPDRGAVDAGAKVCVARRCISEGEVRFTLTWTGDDDLDLVVVAPDGRTASYNERARHGDGGGGAAGAASTPDGPGGGL